MTRTEFLETIKGQEHVHFQRQMKILYLRVIQEAQTKAISNSEARFFRESVLKQLRKSNRRRFKGDIVLEISFFSTSKAPQPVQTLVKNYLDLLHKAMPDVDKNKELVFNDDNQIKFLIANHYPGCEKPCIYIKAYRFSSFVKDAEYVQNIMRNNFSDRSYSIRSEFDVQTRFAFRDSSLGELIRDFYQLRKKGPNLNSAIPLLDEDILRKHIFDEYVKQNELSLEYLLEYLKSLFSKNREYDFDETFQKLSEITREYLFIGLDFIPMGGTPIKEGESKIFRIHLQNQLKKFVADHPYLFPLLSPVGLTIVCIPPAYRVPDVDNLARQIVSFFDEICRPPLTPTSLPGVPTYRSLKTKISTSSYQILFLPRRVHDPENGKIMVLLGNGFMSLNGLWAKMESLIKQWEDYVKFKI